MSASNVESVVVVPGDRIGTDAQFRAGQGCYILNHLVFASVCGKVNVINPVAALPQNKVADLPLIEVLLPAKGAPAPPEIGDVVICKVAKVSSRAATVDIISVEKRLLRESFAGTIRLRDVRKHEVDSVEIYKSFRPGDIVRAKVISLGDTRSYYLSTASNELGVMLAYSCTTGKPMTPVSWQQMQDDQGNKEWRKVAKIQDDAN